jgi:hypothetical protein
VDGKEVVVFLKLVMGDKAVWDNANVKHFIDICKEKISAGNRPNGCFTRTGWKNLEDKLFARTGLKLVKSRLKNKLDNMRKDYTVFIELKNAATGLGWMMQIKLLLALTRGGMNILR